MQFPGGYCGTVVVKNDMSLQCEDSFDTYTLWNLQDPPSADDKHVKATQWMELAGCVRFSVVVYLRIDK